MKLPRFGASTFVSRWILATIAVSIVAVLDGGWTASWLALAPARIWHGQLWRLVTWPLVEHGPIQLILTCASIYKFGGELAIRWGDRRLRRFALQLVVGAAVVTTLLATATGATELARHGGWAVAEMLTIAWARQFPDATLVVYGLLALNGRRLIRFTCGVAIVLAIYLGPVWMAPELAACAAATWYPRGWLRH